MTKGATNRMEGRVVGKEEQAEEKQRVKSDDLTSMRKRRETGRV